MKLRAFFFFAFISFSSQLLPQIDTNDIYPMHIGDVWQYSNGSFFDPIKNFSVQITKDTLLPNGKKYFVFAVKYNSTGEPSYFFQREEGNKVYQYSRQDTCSNNEYLIYNFSVPDSTIWVLCDSVLRGFSNVTSRYIPIMQKDMSNYSFHEIKYELGEWTWAPISGVIKNLIKGIGLYSEYFEGTGNFTLSAAIINGVKIGNLTSVKDESIIPATQVIKAYPNPFNNYTRIKYTIAKESDVNIKLVNILGKEVESIYKGYHNSGKYELDYNAKNLSSGIYFIVLLSNSGLTAQKIILLK